jgi:GxxExxY protein
VKKEDQKIGNFGDGSYEVIAGLVEVHRCLGPGLLESAYETCVCQELALRGIPFERQRSVPLEYKGVALDCGYRIDILVDDWLVLELKAVERLLPVHSAQVFTYLRLSGPGAALLVNFNVPSLRDGLRRLSLSPRPNS